MSEQEPWVSVEGVAKHLGIACDTVYRWIEAKALPAHKIDHLWKFKLTEVNEWVRAGSAVAESPKSGVGGGTIAMLRRAFIDSPRPREWKTRFGPSGIHLFDRTAGLNVLLDEVTVESTRWSRAPRQVSVALTNRCDLACAHCYAPKSRDALHFDTVTCWLSELDANGTLGVGFGGGEPTLYPRFAELCRHAARETTLSVSFTTHGHHIDRAMADSLQGSVHFR